jgi:hypothetical protein
MQQEFTAFQEQAQQELEKKDKETEYLREMVAQFQRQVGQRPLTSGSEMGQLVASGSRSS